MATAMRRRGILVYDGDCGFCTRTARWLRRRVPAGVDVRPWQTLDLDALGLTEAEVRDAAYWVTPRGRRLRGEAAIAAALRTAGEPWRSAGDLILAPGIRRVAARVYDVVARNRHRFPGGTDACELPSAPTVSSPG